MSHVKDMKLKFEKMVEAGGLGGAHPKPFLGKSMSGVVIKKLESEKKQGSNSPSRTSAISAAAVVRNARPGLKILDTDGSADRGTNEPSSTTPSATTTRTVGLLSASTFGYDASSYKPPLSPKVSSAIDSGLSAHHDHNIAPPNNSIIPSPTSTKINTNFSEPTPTPIMQEDKSHSNKSEGTEAHADVKGGASSNDKPHPTTEEQGQVIKPIVIDELVTGELTSAPIMVMPINSLSSPKGHRSHYSTGDPSSNQPHGNVLSIAPNTDKIAKMVLQHRVDINQGPLSPSHKKTNSGT
jgi:hypothetical protein